LTWTDETDQHEVIFSGLKKLSCTFFFWKKKIVVN